MVHTSFALLVFFILIQLVSATLDTHRYAIREPVKLYVNRVGPFHNPQEFYLFFSLPFCQPPKFEGLSETLGEALLGYELVDSALSFPFKVDVATTTVCSRTLNPSEVNQFQNAIRNQFWYQLFVDDLPVWGMVGEVLEDFKDNAITQKDFLYTHWKFIISYTEDRIIEVNLTTENPTPLDSLTERAQFTYSVFWKPSTKPFQLRFDKYLERDFFEHKIHWLSIGNSVMLVVFLGLFVMVIFLRTVRKDYGGRHSKDDDLDEGDLGEESGWKQLHGDVFRAPQRLVLFSSFLGTGIHLFFAGGITLALGHLGQYYSQRGGLLTVALGSYVVSSFAGGYLSGAYYARNGGKNWIQTAMLTVTLFPLIAAVTTLVSNFLAISYQSLNYVPFGSLLVLVLLWALLVVPIGFGGSILGRNWSGHFPAPCRVNIVPRPIPHKKWYSSWWANGLLSGLLPFGTLFIELYFLYSSLWQYKVYYVFHMLTAVAVVLALVCILVAIVGVYFQLNSEDYRWQWAAMGGGLAVGFYVVVYSVYYEIAKTHMVGLLQLGIYAGDVLILALGVAFACGAISYLGASYFVYRIYSVKFD